MYWPSISVLNILCKDKMTIATVLFARHFWNTKRHISQKVKCSHPLAQKFQFQELYQGMIQVCKNIHREMLVLVPSIIEKNWK